MMRTSQVPRRIEPHQTPGSSSGDSGRTTRLPTELLSEQAQRLVVFSTVALVLWTFALMLDSFIMPWLWDGWVRNWRAIVLQLCGSSGSAVWCWYLRQSDTTLENKSNAGILMMLMHGAGIAAFNAWAVPPAGTDIMRISWICLLILISAMIAPSTPRRMLVASLIVASFDPLAYWLAWLFGGKALNPAYVFVICWPTYACAFVAVVPARVLHRLGRRLREAQELGSYQLVERLGTGGMGEVWRAEHRLLARDAAIKLMKPEVLGARDDDEAQLMLRRFEREAQATAALSSPHTIQVFDFGVTQDGTFYYVMELLAGRDLESLVREFGPLPPNRVIYLLRQVCHSLADAHARGLVHRDIKPANIYVCRMGLEYDFVKVLDFGLVKIQTGSGRRDTQTLATLENSTPGTPAYMAPEVILGESDVDRRADVYSLGCVAYFLLTGELVFEADSSMKMLMQHLHAQPVAPSERTELPVPRELDEIVLACLQKDPKLRPQEAGELYQMACQARTRDEWSSDEAKRWWRVHLPQLTGPLKVSELRRDAAEAVTR
jgi:tRNA A-37 threonylcarbamoyl transferase component Bud32